MVFMGWRWAAVGLVLAVPVVSWWAIGDLSFRPDFPDSLDYMYREPYLAPGLELAIGLSAVAVALMCLTVLVRATRAGLMDRRYWLPLYVGAVTGVFAAVIERSVTAGVVGANIGGSLLFFVGIPMDAIVVLVALGLVVAIEVTRRRHRADVVERVLR